MASEMEHITVVDHTPPRYVVIDSDGETHKFDTEAAMHVEASALAEAKPGKFVDLYIYVGSKRLSEDQS